MKPLAVLDTECYKDYWLCKIRSLATGGVRSFEIYEGHPLASRPLRETLAKVTVVTFNGINYDQVMISAACKGYDCAKLKEISDFIIVGNHRPWDVEKAFGFQRLNFDQIDLLEVVPGFVSLKVYMGRLHCPTLQDLPIEHNASIAPEQRPIVLAYNDNDLLGTEWLYRKFEKQIDLRTTMSKQYSIDLRSKSDAQIAEAIIKHELTSRGIEVFKRTITPSTFKFKFPGFLSNAGPITYETMKLVRSANFVVDTKGKVKIPKEISSAKIVIGNGVYRMGNGGLHSSEKTTSHYSGGCEDILLIDRDVASYYPAMIIGTELYPTHLGRPFLEVYDTIFRRRLAAKKAGDKTTADTLKIVLNGSFGKFGSPYSVLYAPDLMIQTTVGGQLSLLMLIEAIEAAGIPVVSANTDGIVIKCPRVHYDRLGAVISQWEAWTGFETEETRYASIHSRDVNNYIAVKPDGSVKLKGAYAEPEPVASSWPSPHNQICVQAVCDLIVHGVPIDLTVRACSDIRQMVEVRTVTGGGTWNGEYLGRAVRWYMAKGGAPILNRKGARVAGTADCRPLMHMDGTIPADIDLERYIAEAEGIVKDIGFVPMAERVFA